MISRTSHRFRSMARLRKSSGDRPEVRRECRVWVEIQELPARPGAGGVGDAPSVTSAIRRACRLPNPVSAR